MKWQSALLQFFYLFSFYTMQLSLQIPISCLAHSPGFIGKGEALCRTLHVPRPCIMICSSSGRHIILEEPWVRWHFDGHVLQRSRGLFAVQEQELLHSTGKSATVFIKTNSEETSNAPHGSKVIKCSVLWCCWGERLKCCLLNLKKRNCRGCFLIAFWSVIVFMLTK